MNCTVRVEKGSEISAACGQLRTDEAQERAVGVAQPEDESMRLPVVPVHGRRQAASSPAPSQPQ